MKKEVKRYQPIHLFIEVAIIAMGIFFILNFILTINDANGITILTVSISGVILALSVWIGYHFFLMKPLARIRTNLKHLIAPSSRQRSSRYVKNISLIEDMIEDLTLTVQSRFLPSVENEKRKKMLLASICHDLRTPLTSLIGYIEATEDHVGNPDDNLKIMHERAYFLNKLIDDLDVYAKNDLNELTVYRKKILVSDFLRSTINGFNDTRITLEEPVVAAFIFADSYRFIQVVDNVVSNARKHAKTQILITTSIDETYYSIRIRDDGDGIPKQFKDKIFDPFFMVNTKGNGSGLGLAITKNLMEAHEGSIELVEHVGSGAEFLIKFPLARNI